MLAPPATASPSQLGPLPAPSEDELAAAYPELRDSALTLPWAAERLAVEPTRLGALARAGELLVVPGPWSMQQAHASGQGFFVPAWQLSPGGRAPSDALPALLEAAFEHGWTSLDLHRFMTVALGEDGVTPGDLLGAGEAERVLALVRGEPDPRPPSPQPSKRRRFALPRLLRREAPA